MINKDFESWSKKRLVAEVKLLHKLINEADEELKKHRDNEANVLRLMAEYKHKLSDVYWASSKNERGAGRKTKLNDDVIVKAKQYRADGKSFKEISLLMGLSVGLVHRASNSTKQEVVHDGK